MTATHDGHHSSQDTRTRRGTIVLRHAGQDVADYVWHPDDLPQQVSPRPFLHPVRTLGGTTVTALMPPDHLHHLGASVAVPDLGGYNFWGGRTFVAGHGPLALDNHGTQRHEKWISRSPGVAEAALCWIGPHGGIVLRERRRLAVVPLRSDCWALDMTFELTNTTADPVSFASPATNGRPGAGYGGFFWRAPHSPTGVLAFGPAGRGIRHLHGRRSDWIAMTGISPGDADNPAATWTLIFVAADERTRTDPWFVRTGDYAGVGSCLAWDRPLVVLSNGTLRRRIITVVADGVLSADRSAGLAATVAGVNGR